MKQPKNYRVRIIQKYKRNIELNVVAQTAQEARKIAENQAEVTQQEWFYGGIKATSRSVVLYGMPLEAL